MLTTMRVWALNQDVILDQQDIEYCKNNGIRLDTTTSKYQSFETHGRVYHYPTEVGCVKLTTVDDTGEAMLQLRYSDKVKLLSRIMTDTMSI